MKYLKSKIGLIFLLILLISMVACKKSGLYPVYNSGTIEKCMGCSPVKDTTNNYIKHKVIK